MADVNTKYLRRVIIECENGTHMDDLDFTLEFYVFTEPRLTFAKSDLIRIVSDEEVMFFASIDSGLMGHGAKGCTIKCRAAITDKEPRLDGMKRTVILNSKTGIVIGAHCCEGAEPYCECYDEGYKIKFEAVNDIPKQDARFALLRYGVISQPIASYGDITEEMVINFTTSESVMDFPIEVKQGDKLVMLVNADMDYYGCKNDGFGGKVPFNTEVLGANGEYSLLVEDAMYRVYGEFSLVSGVVYINTMK